MPEISAEPFGRLKEEIAQKVSRAVEFGRGKNKHHNPIRRILERPVTRREVLKGALKLASAGVATTGVARAVSAISSVAEDPKKHTRTKSVVKPHVNANIGEQIEPELPQYLQELYDILNTPPFQEDGHTQNGKRTEMEKAYVTALMKRPRDEVALAEIDDGLSVLADTEQNQKRLLP